MTTSHAVAAIAHRVGSVGTVDGTARRVLPPAAAALLGWLAVALDNAIHILTRSSRPEVPASVRVMHLAIDFGQTLAIGLAVAAAVALFVRFAPKRRYLPYAAALLGSVVVFQVVLPGDLDGAVDRWTDSRGGDALVRLLAAVLALSVPLLLFAGRLLARPLFRALGVLAGLAVIAANDYVLVNGYPGGHVWIAVSGATLVAAALRGFVLGPWSSRATPLAARIALAALTPLALMTVALRPPARVALELLERDTAFLAPALTALHAPRETANVPVPNELRPWYEPRTHHPAVPQAGDHSCRARRSSSS